MGKPAKKKRQLHLGHALAADGSTPESLTEAVRLAESAAFDFILFDGRRGPGATGLDPFTAAAHAAVRSTRIGLLVSGDPLRHEPFNLARLVASLDHISGGRAGWLVDEEHPGGDRSGPLARATAEERTREFIALVRGLWDSWEDDAFVRDKETGAFVDGDKIHAVEHAGTHFQVRGPLNLARPPQGHPVLARSGTGELAAAAADAELVLPGTGPSGGAGPGLVLPNLTPVVGADVAEVRALHEELHATERGEAARGTATVLIGDPATIADRIEEAFTAGEVDGYVLHAPPRPDRFRRFTEQVVPLLRRRGLFRQDYAGRTLRSHLSLPRPAGRSSESRDRATPPPPPLRTGTTS